MKSKYLFGGLKEEDLELLSELKRYKKLNAYKNGHKSPIIVQEEEVI